MNVHTNDAMSSVSKSAASRRPIHLPRRPTSAASAQVHHTDTDININTTNSSANAAPRSQLSPINEDNEEDRHFSSKSPNWMDTLHSFAHHQTELAAAAAITGVRSIRRGTLAALSRMRPHASSPSSSSARIAAGVAIPFHRRRRRGGQQQVEETDMNNDALNTSSPTTRRVMGLVEAFNAVEARLEVDEGYFDDVAEVEACVMDHLREWQANTNADHADSNTSNNNTEEDGRTASLPASIPGSRRASGLATAQTADISRLSNAVATSGLAGGRRVEADLARVRECTATMSELHDTLATLEEEHRELQRHYIVENTFDVELDALCEQLEDVEREVQAAPLESLPSPSPSRAEARRHRRPRHGGHTKEPASATRQQEREAVEATLAACHDLAETLRGRAAMVAERLTDELLWMRAERDRHDWSVVRAATPLTRMEAVTVTMRGGDGPSAPWHPPNAPHHLVHGKERRAADVGATDEGHASVTSSRLSLDSLSSTASTAFSHSGERDAEDRRNSDTSTHRESFLLRVRVPVFASTTAPPLLAGGDAAAPCGLNSRNSSGRPSRTNLGGTTAGGPSMGGDAGRLVTATATPGTSRRSSTAASASAATSVSTATVSVVATPARYALVQLYESCVDFLAGMLARLTHVRAVRAGEADQMRREHSSFDMYDPAAEDVASRHAAVVRYVAQLDGWVGEVADLYQALHVRVKVPVDAALQTYERFRTQLLEVMKQRLEQDEGRTTFFSDAEDASLKDEKEEEEGEESERHGAEVPFGKADADSGVHHPKQDEEEEHQQQQQRTTASLSQERARRSTQSPQASPSPIADDLPRASAEFIGMLDTLLRSQEKAASEPAAAAAAVVENSKADEKVEATDVAAETPADVTLIRMTSTADGLPAAAFVEEEAGQAPTHLAGHRRPREADASTEVVVVEVQDVADEAKVQATPMTATGEEATAAATALPASSPAPSRGIVGTKSEDAAVLTVVVSSPSTSADREEEEEDEEEKARETEDDSPPTQSPPHPRVPERRRYGLLSEEGFSGGIRAFFSAVARRVMDFSDSGDEDDENGEEAETLAHHRKRARRE